MEILGVGVGVGGADGEEGGWLCQRGFYRHSPWKGMREQASA